jgi:type II secretory pathway pseudopilin PulG
MTNRGQCGFTLLEIVLWVLIAGLILAGVLKGEEMITGVKVKRVASQLDEIRTAYLGFQDRFQALPGDFTDAAGTLSCGSTCPVGNGDSRIRANETPVASSQVHEDILVWTHLAASGFLKGDYRMTAGESAYTDVNAPKNPYSTFLQIAFDGEYGISGASVVRHNLKTGAQVPVEVAAELDRKIDDGKPYLGQFQFSRFAANGAPQPLEGTAAGCTTSLAPDADWNLRGGSRNCGAATLL